MNLGGFFNVAVSVCIIAFLSACDGQPKVQNSIPSDSTHGLGVDTANALEYVGLLIDGALAEGEAKVNLDSTYGCLAEFEDDALEVELQMFVEAGLIRQDGLFILQEIDVTETEGQLDLDEINPQYAVQCRVEVMTDNGLEVYRSELVRLRLSIFDTSETVEKTGSSENPGIYF